MGNTLFFKKQETLAQTWVHDKIFGRSVDLNDHVQCILVWENRKTDDGKDSLPLKRHPNILFSGSKDKSIRIWNLSNGGCLHIWNNAHSDAVNCLKQWNKWLISGSSRTIRIWKIDEKTFDIKQEGRNCIATLTGQLPFRHGLEIWNNSLVSVSIDKSICIWKYQQQRDSNDLNFICSQQIFYDESSCFCIKSWGDRIALGYNRSCSRRYGGTLYSDYDSFIGIWGTGGNRNTIHLVNVFIGHTATVICLEVWNNQLISGSRDDTIRLWNSNGKCLSILHGHTSSVNCILIWDNILFSGSRDMIKIWDLKGKCFQTITTTKKNIGPSQTEYINALAISNGKLISVSNDGTGISIWKQNEYENTSL